jgi:hypothetical protein
VRPKKTTRPRQFFKIPIVNHPVTYLWFEAPRGQRLAAAQLRLEESIETFRLEPLRFPAGPRLVPIGDVLHQARERATGRGFVWCNTDVILTRDPFDVPDPECVYGFHRREVPSGEQCGGVDMYYIPFGWWDNYLSKDVPRLLIGASYVDWWISRAMEKAGHYRNLEGYIDHPTHLTSAASGSDADPGYQANFKNYNRWAARNGLPPIPAPPLLIPRAGHVWGVRSLLEKLRRSEPGRE